MSGETTFWKTATSWSCTSDPSRTGATPDAIPVGQGRMMRAMYARGSVDDEIRHPAWSAPGG